MNSQMYPGMNYPSTTPVMSTAAMPVSMNYPTNNQTNNMQGQGGMNYPSNNPGSINYVSSTPVTSGQIQGTINYSSINSSSATDQMQGGHIYPSSDSITSAVVSNIHSSSMKKSSVSCNECNLAFTSQVVMDAHLQGSRHAKQMKSKNILASLEQTNVAFTKDQETNGLKCNVCNVFLNSIQQLQTHLNGNRHKKKLSKGNWDEREVITKANVNEIPSKYLPRPAEKNSQLMCKSCRKYFNSQSQLDVHMKSQKHLDKISGKINEKAMRYSPYYKSRKLTDVIQKPLTNNFVSGGYQQYA